MKKRKYALGGATEAPPDPPTRALPDYTYDMAQGPSLAGAKAAVAAQQAALARMAARRPRSMRDTGEASLGGAGQMFSKGGSVSASKRADGCAQRGKTKGKMV